MKSHKVLERPQAGAEGGDEVADIAQETWARRGISEVANRGQSVVTLNPVGAAVRRMLNRSGNSLFTAIEPLTEAEFFVGGANGISVAWTVGHLACVFDLFTSWIHGGGCKLPKEVHGVFNSLDVKPPGGPSKAEVVTGSGYEKGEILFMLRSSQIAALKLLGACSEEAWEATPPGPHPDNLHTVGEIWEHLAVHTYWHMGELCGTFPRFHGTYTLNMLPHYFYFVPGEGCRE
jgi:hypothetical protein